MSRITDKDLQGMVFRLNRLTNSPETYSTDGKCNIGHYHIDHAYGGVCLHRISNDGGGVSTPLHGGHIPKRELYDQIYAFIAGIQSTQQ